MVTIIEEKTAHRKILYAVQIFENNTFFLLFFYIAYQKPEDFLY